MNRSANRDAAAVLFNVATILELAEDNPYRVRAYRRAARLLMRSDDDLRRHLTDEHELDLPGLGPRLRRKLGELVGTGNMRFYVELVSDLPEPVGTLMSIPAIGPKTARRLHEELGVATPAEVYDAAQSGKIRQLFGFGVRREQQILDGAAQVLAGQPKIYAPLPPETDDERPIDELPSIRLVERPAPPRLDLPEAA
jgi:DNA polymerase (family 10)